MPPVKPAKFEIGINTLGEWVSDAQTGQKISARQRLGEIIEMAKLADAAGLDVFGVGEHHSADFVVSSVPVVLAAIAQSTSRVRLTSGVTILSTSDPVREFEEFATLDLLSNGRAEIMAGRGAFIESFPLFGFNLNDYDELFSEKLGLLLQLVEDKPLNWEGKFRPALTNARVAPRPVQEKLPVWIGVGGTPESFIRAGVLGLPMMLGIIGGAPAQFKPLVDLYRKAAERANHPTNSLRTGVTSYVHLAETSQQAIEEFYPYHAHYFDQIGRSRGRNMRLPRNEYTRATSLDGAYFVGSPQQIIEKILYQHELFGHSRFLAQVDIGGLPLKSIARTIELLATEVAPVVRQELEGKVVGDA